jgi:prevent-host-death family protein
MGRVEVSNDELRTIRDATRELGKLVESLESGDAEKFVITKHGQMRAVVVSVDSYSEMRPGAGFQDLPRAA